MVKNVRFVSYCRALSLFFLECKQRQALVRKNKVVNKLLAIDESRRNDSWEEAMILSCDFVFLVVSHTMHHARCRLEETELLTAEAFM